MEQKITLRYYNAKLNIALLSWKEVYLLEAIPVPLIPEVSKGNLVYRRKGASKRFSYRQIKKGLVKKTIVITQPLYF